MTELQVSAEAAELLSLIRSEYSGVLTITIDGGCCEGTAPHLYEDYVLPYGVHEIGQAEGIPVYIPGSLTEQYAAATVSLDLIEDAGSDAMSIETSRGKRLVLRYG